MPIRRILNWSKNFLTSYKKVDIIYDSLLNDHKSSKINLGQIQSRLNNEIINPSSLKDLEFSVFSQFGDDGIIQWLVNKLPLPNKTFIEFGVEDYREANTRFLLINNYWSGMVIDGSSTNVGSIKSSQIHTFYDLQAEHSFITKNNIDDLIETARFNSDVGLLSVDIDGNDYWVWQAIRSIKPIIVICEYNSLFGFEDSLTIKYRPDFIRGTEHPFNFYGTSLCAACDLASEKGYSFVGCNSAGNNAYFIRNDFVHYLPLPVLTPQEGYVFSSFTEVRNEKGLPMRGVDKIKSLDNLEAFNTREGAIRKVNAEKIILSLVKCNKLARF